MSSLKKKKSRGICHTVEKHENKTIIQITADRIKNSTLGPVLLFTI